MWRLKIDDTKKWNKNERSLALSFIHLVVIFGWFSQKTASQFRNKICHSTESPGPAILSAVKIKLPKIFVNSRNVMMQWHKPRCHCGGVNCVDKALDGLDDAGLLPHAHPVIVHRVWLNEDGDGEEEEERNSQSGQETWPGWSWRELLSLSVISFYWGISGGRKSPVDDPVPVPEPEPVPVGYSGAG